MNFLKLTIAAVLIVFVGTSCESIGLLGQGGVKGSKAKEEILSIAQQTTIINAAVLGSGAVGLIGIVVDGVVVPGLAGINESAHYSRPSVDSCKSKIASVGLIVGTWISAITCDLKKTPMLLQIGDGDTGSVLQLGPLGL